MSKCDIAIEFDRADRRYRGGETVSGRVHVQVNSGMTSKGITLTRLWKTHGYGNVDSGERIKELLDSESRFAAGESRTYAFSFVADLQPLTYRGHHINIDHYVRVDVDVPWAFDPSHEEEFVLLPGKVPAEMTGRRDEIIDFEVEAPSNTSALPTVIVGVVVLMLVFLAVWLLPIFLVLIGIFWVRRRMVVRRLGEVRLSTPRLVVGTGEDWPLELEFTPKKSFRINGIEVRIQCQEAATTGNGTSRSTRKHLVHDEMHVLKPAGQLSAGEKYHESLAVPLPDTIAHSFSESNNKITWTAEVRIDIPMYPDWASSKSLQLLPAEFFVDETVEVSNVAVAVQPMDDVEVDASQQWTPDDKNTGDDTSDAPGPDEKIPDSAPSNGTSPELLDLVAQINKANKFGNDREQLVASWTDRELTVVLDVERVSSTMGIGVDASYKNGRSIRGKIVDLDQQIEVLTRNDQTVEGLSGGDRSRRRIRPAKWDSLHDLLVVLDISDG